MTRFLGLLLLLLFICLLLFDCVYVSPSYLKRAVNKGALLIHRKLFPPPCPFWHLSWLTVWVGLTLVNLGLTASSQWRWWHREVKRHLDSCNVRAYKNKRDLKVHALHFTEVKIGVSGKVDVPSWCHTSRPEPLLSSLWVSSWWLLQ